VKFVSYIIRVKTKQETKMVIGGYSMEDNGVYGITVKQHESGWSFFMQGDDAEIFRCEWKLWQLRTGESFENFLYAHEYNTLLN
tara:strand:- start:207 stop:458 length:252 start_codon:yes stop_codon:yes gene_type:complete